MSPFRTPSSSGSTPSPSWTWRSSDPGTISTTLALPRADEVLLIVEVADTTLRYDREIKIPLFARHGIPEVWLIDVDGRTLTVFETPADGRYRNERHVRPSAALAPKALPGVEVDLSRRFGTA